MGQRGSVGRGGGHSVIKADGVDDRGEPAGRRGEVELLGLGPDGGPLDSSNAAATAQGLGQASLSLVAGPEAMSDNLVVTLVPSWS